jgi:multidrug efflux pump subunit AcrA (membrane-fusion protein)
VTLPVDRRANALVIPASAVAVANDGPYVFVVNADTLIRRSVDLGLATGGWVESTNGVEEGEHVVTSGLAALRPGMIVRVQREETQ